MVKVAIGQDSHRFDPESSDKKLVLGGVVFDGEPPLQGNSDADVVMHAITNAVSGITGVNIIGKISDEMCRNGTTDSSEYLRLALTYLADYKINHLSVAIECQRPILSPRLAEMKNSIAEILQISPDNIGITATSGEDLTAFGEGRGIQAFAVATATKRQ